MDLESAVRAATGGDLDAFGELTRRFQHMAFGYALSFVRDLGQAEDVFARPFYVAEPYTKRPGVTVGLAESLRVCREILDGVHDGVPTKAFYFTAGLDAVLANAAAR